MNAVEYSEQMLNIATTPEAKKNRDKYAVQEKMQRTGEKLMAQKSRDSLQSVEKQAVLKDQSLSNLMSQTSYTRFVMAAGGQNQKLHLAPKIKGGTIAQKKRKTDFPVASELRI